MQVLITGANGTVGTAILDELREREAYEFTAIDLEEHPTVETTVADVADYDAIRPAFDDQDAVVHLAAYPDVDGTWEDIHSPNVRGTANVLKAAADAGVDNFVFASSIHTVGLYENELAPDLYDPDFDLKIEHTDPPRPDSFYGVSKVFGEALGRLYVEGSTNPLAELDSAYTTPAWESPKRFYSLRINTVRPDPYDHPYGLAEAGVDDGRWNRGFTEYELMADRLKCTWLSHRDCAHLVDLCLQDDTVEFDVFFGVSDNDGRWCDISHARAVLGYDPADNGAEWESPPE